MQRDICQTRVQSRHDADIGLQVKGQDAFELGIVYKGTSHSYVQRD